MKYNDIFANLKLPYVREFEVGVYMKPSEIRSRLKKCGYLMSDLARELGVSGPAVRNTIYSLPFPSPTVRRRISDILGVQEGDLWPD